MREPISISVFLYREINNSRNYLLFKRVASPELALSDFWQSITGGKESGESLENTVLREVLEESGISLTNISQSVFQYEYPIKPEWYSKYPKSASTIKEFVFAASINSDPILSSEHSEFGWFSFEKAKSLLGFDSSIKALCAVEASLNAKQ